MAPARKTRAAKRAAAAAAAQASSPNLQDADATTATEIHIDETSTPEVQQESENTPSITEETSQFQQVSLTMGMTPSSFSSNSSTSSAQSPSLSSSLLSPMKRNKSNRTPRTPFSEITANFLEQVQSNKRSKDGTITMTVQHEGSENVAPSPTKKKGKAKKSKASGKKKGNKKKVEEEGEEDMPQFNLIVAEEQEDVQVPGSPASDEAVELLKDGFVSDGMVLDDDVLPSSTSPAVQAVGNHIADEQSSPSVISATPLAVRQLESLFQPTERAEPSNGLDAFPNDMSYNTLNTHNIQKIPITPGVESQGAASPREDAIDALDALEDAIEKVGNAIESAHTAPPDSPTAQSARTDDTKITEPTPILDAIEKKSLVFDSQTQEVSDPSPVAAVTAKPDAKTSEKKTTKARPTSLKAPITATKSQKAAPTTRQTATITKRSTSPKSASTDSQASKLKTGTSTVKASKPKAATTVAEPSKPKPKPVISSLQAPPPVLKSSKAPTQPTSRPLPGDSVAAQMKAKREARLKQKEDDEKRLKVKDEDEKKVKQELRARTAPRPSSMEVKLTAAALARTKAPIGTDKSSISSSSAATAPTTTSTTTTRHESQAQSAKPAGATKTTTTEKRQSTLMRGTIGSHERRASTMAIRGKPALSELASTSSTSTAPAIVEDKSKKVDAVRKARIEAAERGRLASKEWAEKRHNNTMNAKGVVVAAAANNSKGPAS